MLDKFTYREMMREIFSKYNVSQEWKSVRERVIARDKGFCVDCGELGVIVHHEHYQHWGKGNYEEVKTCVLVCRGCHTKRHARDIDVPFFAQQNETGMSDKDFDELKEIILSLP